MVSTASDTLNAFVTHYVALGVRSDHMTIVLHTPNRSGWDPLANAARKVLIRHRVGHIVRTAVWSAAIKMHKIARHAEMLPAHAWLIWADADELAYFPCELTPTPVCGEMIDLLPHRWTPPPADLAAAELLLTSGLPQVLRNEFPICARGRYTALVRSGSTVEAAKHGTQKTVSSSLIEPTAEQLALFEPSTYSGPACCTRYRTRCEGPGL